VDGFQVLSVDPAGKRAVVSCSCGGTHVVGVEALRNGSIVCHATALSPSHTAICAPRPKNKSGNASSAAGVPEIVRCSSPT
jgi:hypothetical protein